MNEGIIPLHRRGKNRNALDRVDVSAVQLLTDGKASSLLAARAEVILADMRTHRDQMTTLLADLRGRGPTCDPQIDAANGNLIAAIDSGIVQIDVFISRAQVFLAEAAKPGPSPPEILE